MSVGCVAVVVVIRVVVGCRARVLMEMLGLLRVVSVVVSDVLGAIGGGVGR